MSWEYIKVCGTQLLNRWYDHLPVGITLYSSVWIGRIRHDHPLGTYATIYWAHTWSTDLQRLQGIQMRSSSQQVYSWQVPPKEAQTLMGQWWSIPSWWVKVLEGIYWTKIPLLVCKLICWLDEYGGLSTKSVSSI